MPSPEDMCQDLTALDAKPALSEPKVKVELVGLEIQFSSEIASSETRVE
ncbi:MAG: hypothetical protein VXY77_01360 [Pseudomonadota bacterium]|nr:hypothetical protein [Pseudomonadota bacterium]